jgi:hypothetical protein
MPVAPSYRRAPIALGLLALLMLASCARRPAMMSAEECMTRVMYFESNRSSAEGMLAVGTVVMNRVNSGKYPKSVCGVVGQKNQFAPGVLSKPMGQGRELAAKTARVVLRGRKHPEVGKAMFFHTAGYSYPYTNMHYVAIAGGNAFYEKRRNATSTQASVAARGNRLSYDPPERRIAARVAAPAQIMVVPDPVTPADWSQPQDIRTFQARPEALPQPQTLQVPTASAAPEVLAPMSIDEIIAGQGLY